MAFRRILSALFVVVTAVPHFDMGRELVADDRANPLQPLAWAVGGKWVADIKNPDGSPMRVEASFRWSNHKKAITYDVVFKTKDASWSQYEGTYFWHPGKKAITLVEVNAHGGVTEGVLKPEGAMLVQTNLNTQADGTPQEQRVELVRKGEDVFAFEAFVKKDGKFVKAVGFTYSREKSS
ncbi:MAG: hypothetical protein JWN86_641 [Planctomycetota bacterium]|nr:hypothetical protein [Planctomycetota bacterium]